MLHWLPLDEWNCNTPNTAAQAQEVLYLNGLSDTISAAEWPAFEEKQIALLVADGFSTEAARQVYAGLDPF